MPDTSLSEIASGLREWGRISQLQLPNQEEAEVQRMSLNKLVRSRMNRLRVAGTLKVGG